MGTSYPGAPGADSPKFKAGIETDPAKIRQLRAAETANAQPIYGAYPVDLISFDGRVRRCPVVYCDCRRRPAVADLWRVMAQEPDQQGDIIADWRVLRGAGAALAVLNVQWTAPVSLRLRIVLSLRGHRDFLVLAATLGYVLLASKPPAECVSRPHTVGVPVEGAVLAAGLVIDALDVQPRGSA